jgi:aspartate aminotransferase
MKDAGLVVKQYTYYKPATCGLDFEGLMRDVEAAPEKSIFLLHACAHNPTGVDPSKSQWSELSQLMLNKQHIPFFDCAYQGFASGNAEEDAWAIRKFVEDGHCISLAQSYAKNFGLYGERVGALSVVGKDAEEAERLLSQLKIVVRPMYSNPPIYGARIVQTVLENPALYAKWTVECKGMADRIITMRSLLRSKLEGLGNPRPWNHITDQIGMFAFSGLDEAAVARMRSEYGIYMTKDGRISMAGVSSSNVDYIANAIHTVTTK